MAEKYLDTALFDKAAKFVIDAHSNTERRGKGTPYALHVFEAAAITASLTADQEIIIASLLHDVIEDTDYTKEDIEKLFGARVASLVDSETQPRFPGKSYQEVWFQCKQYAVEHIKSGTLESKMVAIGDKLSNLRAIYYDYKHKGEETWKTFHAPDPKLIGWYYRSLLEAFDDLTGTDAHSEFRHLVKKTFGDK